MDTYGLMANTASVEGDYDFPSRLQTTRSTPPQPTLKTHLLALGRTDSTDVADPLTDCGGLDRSRVGRHDRHSARVDWHAGDRHRNRRLALDEGRGWHILRRGRSDDESTRGASGGDCAPRSE